ncbi:hypothetical protein KY347_04540 [Candidatus Woesearchaeota archaeon]|nr:hypothetical protein [Candidatus Woesearchaeota archaeon]
MRTIKSSEIANYLFCPVSWWIGKTKGVKITQVINEGKRHHTLVSENQPKARFVYVCIIISIALLTTLVVCRFLL